MGATTAESPKPNATATMVAPRIEPSAIPATPSADATLPSVTWDVIVAGDDVTNRKPHPEVFTAALEKLGLEGPDGVVVVEDSGEGLEAAQAAGLCCAVVVNGYTADHDLAGADLVMDGFGQVDAPAKVLSDPHGLGAEGILDAALLRKLLRSPR